MQEMRKYFFKGRLSVLSCLLIFPALLLSSFIFETVFLFPLFLIFHFRNSHSNSVRIALNNRHVTTGK